MVVVAIIALGSYQFPKVQTQVQIDSIVEQVKRVFGANPGPVSLVLQEFNGGVQYGKVNSTSTNNTTLTLVASDIVSRVDGAAYDTVIMTPQVGDVTFTFPASSTLSHFIPKTGQRAEQCWQNASSTTGIDITFAAGTGIDLETASSTITDLTLSNGNFACFKFVRATSTASTFDIGVLMTEYNNGD